MSLALCFIRPLSNIWCSLIDSISLFCSSRVDKVSCESLASVLSDKSNPFSGKVKLHEDCIASDFSCNASLSAVQRVNLLFSYLDKPLAQRPDFMTLYFEDVDHAGHTYGPDHEHVGEAIKEVDDAIGYLLQGIHQRNEEVDIIIVSDHGMTNLDPNRRVFLDDYIKEELSQIKFYNFGTLFPNGGPNNQRHVTLEPNNEQTFTTVLRKLKAAHPELRVYDKNEPDFKRFGFTNNRRIGRIVITSNEGWNIALRSLGGTGTRGGHGHDNRYVNMTGIFIANGPSFKRGYRRGPIDSIHIYELLSGIMKVRPAPNSGSFQLVQDVLK